MLRMRIQPWVAHPRDGRMILQETGQFECALVLALDAQRVGVHAKHDEPRVERANHAAEIAQRAAARTVDELALTNDHATHGLAVTGHVLRRAIKDNIYAELKRTLVNRRREGVIQHREDLALTRERADGREIV